MSCGRYRSQAHDNPLNTPASTRKNDRVPMPYVDINPHKQRPKWVGLLILAVLSLATAAVVVMALDAL